MLAQGKRKSDRLNGWQETSATPLIFIIPPAMCHVPPGHEYTAFCKTSFTADLCCASASGTSKVVLAFVAEPGLVFMSFSSFMSLWRNSSFN